MLVRGMAAFVVVASVGQIASSATGGPRNALVLGLAPAQQRLEALGLLRALGHVGWALGAVFGGAVISLDTRPVYLAMLALNGGSYLVYAALVAAADPLARRRRRDARAAAGDRDRPTARTCRWPP